MHPDEQAILVDFYNSLTSTGTLNWATENDLCGQTGVSCDNSTPDQRITILYSFLTILKKNIQFKTFSFVDTIGQSVVVHFLGQSQHSLEV